MSSEAGQHLKTLEEIERDCTPGLVKVLRTEGVEGVRYALWNMTGWHEHYGPCIWRSKATEDKKRVDLSILARGIAENLRSRESDRMVQFTIAAELPVIGDDQIGFLLNNLDRECRQCNNSWLGFLSYGHYR